MRYTQPTEDWHREGDELYHHRRDIFRFPMFEDMLDWFFGGFFNWRG